MICPELDTVCLLNVTDFPTFCSDDTGIVMVIGLPAIFIPCKLVVPAVDTGCTLIAVVFAPILYKTLVLEILY